jgi:hypothetical protein
MTWEFETIDVEQGGDDWHELRRGIPTSSMFKVLLAKGEQKGRQTYLYKLAGERITGIAFSNAAMEDGKAQEPEIRKDYAFMRDCEPQPIGFIRASIPKTGQVICGASPDALIGDDGMIEIKRMAPHLLIPILEEQQKRGGDAGLPMTHYAQCQGGMLLAERKWCDLVIGFPKMRKAIFRIQRDENYIAELVAAIEVFDLELRRLVERLK